MKNKIFTILLAVAALFIVAEWVRQREAKEKFEHVTRVLGQLETRVKLLKLEARTLQEEVELMRLNNRLGLLSKLKTPKGGRKKNKSGKIPNLSKKKTNPVNRRRKK